MIQQIYEIIDVNFMKNSVRDYLVCIGLLLAGFVIIKLIEIVIIRRLKIWAKKTATTLDDFVVGIVQKLGVPMGYFMIFYLIMNTLTLDPSFKKAMDIALMSLLAIFGARLGISIANHSFKIYLESRGKDVSLERSLNGILKIIKVVVWGVAICFFLDNLGFKISAVIAGLGIGGVAVALAAQAILGDLFSYFAILFDRPFEIGDFIIIDEYLGTIEHIGIKTTRVRSLGGEQLIFSNSDLTGSRVRNYKRMGKRRVVFKIGVTYQTSLTQVKAIPGTIEKSVKSVKDTTFDRAHFASYGDFSLIFEIVYYVLSRDYNKYMDIQQEINFKIKEEFERRGIEFAYPTQTLHVSK